LCDSIQRRPCPGPGPSTALGGWRGWAGRLVGWLVAATGRKNKLSFQRSPPPQHVSVDRTAAVLLINLLAAAATHTHTHVAHKVLPPRKYVCTHQRPNGGDFALCVCVCMHAAQCNELIVHNIARDVQ
ncbi:Uncharacterized protein FWK35_00019792, partial [Aphis craccivora]